jgi:hypothetical protein
LISKKSASQIGKWLAYFYSWHKRPPYLTERSRHSTAADSSISTKHHSCSHNHGSVTIIRNSILLIRVVHYSKSSISLAFLNDFSFIS